MEKATFFREDFTFVFKSILLPYFPLFDLLIGNVQERYIVSNYFFPWRNFSTDLFLPVNVSVINTPLLIKKRCDWDEKRS